MNVIFWKFAIFACLCFTQFCNCNEQCQTSIDWARKASCPLADFAVLLYGTVLIDQRENQSSNNLVISPLSIALSLAVLEAGADSDTRNQIRIVLVKRGSSDSDTANIYQALQYHLQTQSHEATLNIANGLFYQQQIAFKEEYLNGVKNCFQAEIAKCDFQSDVETCRGRINDWIANQTAQKVPELFRQGASKGDTTSVLANALYFKASWKETFSRIETRPFYRHGKEDDQQLVQFFSNEDEFFQTQTQSVTVVGIPYKGEEISLFIVLPKRRDGLSDFEGTLTGPELNFLINRTVVQNVLVKIPKFKISTRLGLKNKLTKLGLNDMFTNAANFSRMTDGRFFVDSAVHEAFINVNENGTEAAAATGLAIRSLSARSAPIPFVADHPFLYAIVHKPTQAILFVGRVVSVES